ncbi:hypothetical protein Ddye_000411 [Dipteronia dyeriana]|uniref:E2 ubiquitin-conjugating enzyme n=1 Tax=Dipteronia dyeriana TaxID=168575 RepID=A0AAD9XM21_9ROSI|nr:hypothetical protein Ddye_000411 [Dipteronia dyeriana]
MSSPSKRREMDVMKLMMSDYSVEPINDGISELKVEFHGPKASLYEGGVWKVRVELPDAYPYKSPSIGFINKIFHPNVDELSGSVCLDVINQTWSPMFDLLNIFEVFLPQLLLYPNPSDPLNGDAASLMMKDQKQYEQRVKDMQRRRISPAQPWKIVTRISATMISVMDKAHQVMTTLLEMQIHEERRSVIIKTTISYACSIACKMIKIS